MLDGDSQDQYDSGGWCFPKPIPPVQRNGEWVVMEPMSRTPTRRLSTTAGTRVRSTRRTRRSGSRCRAALFLLSASFTPRSGRPWCVRRMTMRWHRHATTPSSSPPPAYPRRIPDSPFLLPLSLAAWGAGRGAVHQEPSGEWAAGGQDDRPRRKLAVAGGRTTRSSAHPRVSKPTTLTARGSSTRRRSGCEPSGRGDSAHRQGDLVAVWDAEPGVRTCRCSITARGQLQSPYPRAAVRRSVWYNTCAAAVRPRAASARCAVQRALSGACSAPRVWLGPAAAWAASAGAAARRVKRCASARCCVRVPMLSMYEVDYTSFLRAFYFVI